MTQSANETQGSQASHAAIEEQAVIAEPAGLERILQNGVATLLTRSPGKL